MVRSSQVVVAGTAVGASLLLSGCQTPQFVYGYCDAALIGTAAQSTLDGLNRVQVRCRETFKAETQINQCIASGADVLTDAKKRTLTEFVAQCADYVTSTVCISGTECYNHVDKITPAQARPAVDDYVAVNANSLTVRMDSVLDAHIKELVNEDYSRRFANRAIPLASRSQCRLEIEKKIGVSDLFTQPTQQLFETCKTAGSPYQCEQDGVQKLHHYLGKEAMLYEQQCAKASLLEACPSGSLCGLETEEAPFDKLQQAAIDFLWNNWDGWEKGTKVGLSEIAGGNHGNGQKVIYGRLDEEAEFHEDDANFERPAWQGTGFVTMATVGGSVAGVAAIVAVSRFARKRSLRTDADEERAVEMYPSSETVKLMATEGEEDNVA